MSDRTEWSDDPFEGRDPGLAAERTDLAWSRSGLSLAACGVVIMKGLPTITTQPGRPLVGGAVLALGLGTWLLGLLSARQRRRHRGDLRPTALWHDVAPVAIGTAIVGSAGFLLALFSPG